jgi:hypothetical protein
MNGHEARVRAFRTREEEDAAVFERAFPPEMRTPPQEPPKPNERTAEIMAAINAARRRMHDPSFSLDERDNARAEFLTLDSQLPGPKLKSQLLRDILDAAIERITWHYCAGSDITLAIRDIGMRYPDLKLRGIDLAFDCATARYVFENGAEPWVMLAARAEASGEPLPLKPARQAEREMIPTGKERLERMRRIAKAYAARIVADPGYDADALASEIAAKVDGGLSESESNAAIAMGKAIAEAEFRDLGILPAPARRRFKKPKLPVAAVRQQRKHRIQPSVVAHKAW